MPYQRYYAKLMKDFNKLVKVDYNDRVLAEPMANIIRANKNPEVIDDAIRSMLLNRIEIEGRKVERKRQETLLLSKLNPQNKKLAQEAAAIANPATATFHLMAIMERAANAIAYTQKKSAVYNSVPLFGFNADQMVDLVKSHVNGYNYREGRKFELFKAYGILNDRFVKEAKELEGIKASGKTYENASADEKEKMYRTHITKKLVQEELDSHIFLWKWFHGKEVKAMEAYIKTADELLTGVGFPAETAKDFPSDELWNFEHTGYAMTDPEQKTGLEELFEKSKAKANEKLADPKYAESIAMRKAAMDKLNAKEQEDKKLLDEKIRQANEKREEQKRKEEETALQAREQKRIAQEKSNLSHSNALRQDIEKNAELKAKIEIAQAKPLPERLFDIYFRPSSDPAEFEKEKAACKEWKSKAQNIPNKAVKAAFAYNSMKVGELAGFKTTVFNNETLRKTAENDLIIKAADREKIFAGKFKDYKAPTEKELLEIMELNSKLADDVNSNDKVKVEPPKNEIDQQVKKIEDPTSTK